MLNVKLSNSQLHRLKSATKNGIRVILNLSSNIVNDPNDKNTFLHKLLVANTQVSMFREAFSNGSSAKIKLSKIQLHKIGQSGGILDSLLGPLLKTELLLVGNFLKPLGKDALI